MNYFNTETFTDIDMVNMRAKYHDALERNADLHDHIANLEAAITVYKNVDKRYRKKLGAV